MRFLIPLFVFLGLVILLGVGLTLDPSEVPSPFIGKPAPDFSLPQVGDPAKSLGNADFKGQVSLLNVWASWCVSCRQEHPVLNALSKRGIVPIYGLNYKDERDAALGWLTKLGNPYTASAFDADGKVGIDWGVYGVPETFVIDKQGVIRYKQTGPVTEEVLENTLLPLIRQLQQEGPVS
ncbi:DsbE family thiol:disulfide interchange protein [Methylococcus sp. EFPC2]|uniref:DsbE family thiol:disulfide interchange protein n=1 Tax=Methylococcus sp. EFPC2 TaxID=2812648 RepID=UPI001967B595|nr:DsbE family thiol:disulfide interchange protein [Methylococcus sp. EFPC2]QSA96063.1 DsbE family thiol:disulfide interchange protein [Methylococcus sp. EFPC2]